MNSQSLTEQIAQIIITKCELNAARYWNTFPCAGRLQAVPLHTQHTLLGSRIKAELKKLGDRTIAIVSGNPGLSLKNSMLDYYLEIACLKVLETIEQLLPPQQYYRLELVPA